MPRVAFKTLGCRLNQAETAAMRSRFDMAGYDTVRFGSECDVAVIHTCTITESAERDCAKYARYARRHGATRVVLAGCAVERDAEAVREASGADMVVGQKQKLNLPALLGLQAADTPAPSHALTPAFDATRALLKIQDGCEFRCAYCIVPDTRGTPHSRPVQEILEEAHALAEHGHPELVITGANIGCFRDGDTGLVALLEQLTQIPGVARIRMGSIESTTAERDVIDFMATTPKLCNFLHLPLQSGSDTVLQRMRRRYCAADYEATVVHAATGLSPLGLGADIITGFPGETEVEFQQTLALVQRLPFNNLHVFPYSERPGTPAATMSNPVPKELRKTRANQLIAIGQEKRQAWLDQLVGTHVRVVVEGTDRTGYAAGWSDTYARCQLTTPSPPRGQVVEGTVSGHNGNVLQVS